MDGERDLIDVIKRMRMAAGFNTPERQHTCVVSIRLVTWLVTADTPHYESPPPLVFTMSDTRPNPSHVYNPYRQFTQHKKIHIHTNPCNMQTRHSMWLTVPVRCSGEWVSRAGRAGETGWGWRYRILTDLKSAGVAGPVMWAGLGRQRAVQRAVRAPRQAGPMWRVQADIDVDQVHHTAELTMKHSPLHSHLLIDLLWL